ncbi:unnamed protein product [Bursaphelenchus xylophilus]|uniref:(pine wood nematode) hypothetical protein n=1 Tax=Bursaphelenchus xylophilus TaxID=6326 RepID=A0A1I7RZ95_BURXY|nr:unnamed protein product [Bursaphelenchus xylophilus]CAG9106707.1 unnamed protein product [Bursaphelenchus xylophilus]
MSNRRTLQDDSELITKIKEHYEGLESRMRSLDEKTRDLFFDTELLYNGLEDANNKILLLKNVKYVKEIILDDVVDNRSIRSHLSQPQPQDRQEERTDQMISILKTAARNGMGMVNQRVTEVDVPRIEGTSSELLPKKMYEPLNPYCLNELPPLIGTNEFLNWDYSLVEEEEQKKPEFSEVVVKRTETLSSLPSQRTMDNERDSQPTLAELPSSSSLFIPTSNLAHDSRSPLLSVSKEATFFEDNDFEEKDIVVNKEPETPKQTVLNPQKSVKDEIEALFKRRSRATRSSSESSGHEEDAVPPPLPPKSVQIGVPTPPPVPTRLPKNSPTLVPNLSDGPLKETEVAKAISKDEVLPSTDFIKDVLSVKTLEKMEKKDEDKPKKVVAIKENIQVKDAVIEKGEAEKTAVKNEKTTKKEGTKPKSSIFSDDSDDSFDKVFNVKPRQPEPKPSTSIPTSISTSNPSRRAANQPEEEARKERRKITSKVRSLFDDSSSDEDLFLTSAHSVTKPNVPASSSKEPKKNLFSDSDEEQVQVNKEESGGEESDEDMPKTVLNSVPNDFSNRLNAALLRKPPQPTFIPKLTDPDQVSVKSTSSPKAAQPIDHGPQKSVSALRNQLGDSLTKIHGSKLGVKTEEKKDTIPSRSPTPPKLPSPSSQPSTPGQMNFSAVKARPRGPGGRRPPPPAQTAAPAQATPVQKPPTSTSTTPKTTPSASTKKPAKSLFESDSDDPF